MATGSKPRRFGKFVEYEHVRFYPPDGTTLVDGIVSAKYWEDLEPGHLRIVVPYKSLIYTVPMANVLKCDEFECLGEHDDGL